MRRIGIDVDLTTLESDVSWWNWLQNMCRGEYANTPLEKVVESHNGRACYNLAAYFPEPINRNVHPLDYWRNEGCYDLVKPRDDAMIFINKLIDEGYEIVFITHNKGNGSRSKFNCLTRYFGYGNFSYIVTKEKHLVDVDCLVDDRNEFLNNFTRGKAIRIETPYTQSQSTADHIIKTNDWSEIYELITRN